MITTFDFGDGNGEVPAHQHINPAGSIGGWVANTANVEKTACIEVEALVFGNSNILDNARIYDKAQVFGNAKVTNNAKIGGKAKVCNEAYICDNAHIYGMAKIYGDARIFGDSATNKKTNETEGVWIPPSPQKRAARIKTGCSSKSLRFNKTKIAEIKTESKKLSAMLNAIYEQDNQPTEAPEINNSSVLNLDNTHLEIVKTLATRPEWQRDELQKIMKGMMIDGVLEHINDAFFDYCDEAFIESDDPIEINVQLYKEIFK